MKRELRIRSSLSQLKEVHSFLEEILHDAKISSARSGYINLSVCESVNNAISHGNKHDAEKYVTISACLSQNTLTVEVMDEGVGFDFRKLPDPTSKEKIKSEGGRGLFIIHNLVDQVSFKNNGTIIQLKFKLNREHQFLL
ncbi:ATP-binding protein [Gaoshiqia sediminis]|uniref:ATP-binding protein n=1 Tax=Gaoshiqia sediminis TaxID=2986998 RepID=A0AA41Y8U6_9BACT|nr:ATP-binding protein [Gaoshiqia sediminis]MCW0481463.1 ATP-binding protein [Gaoshiqia sediminis]